MEEKEKEKKNFLQAKKSSKFSFSVSFSFSLFSISVLVSVEKKFLAFFLTFSCETTHMKRKSRENVVKNGDKVVLFGGSANYVVMHAQKGQKFCHKWGVFDWDDIIGQQYGSRVSCAKKTRSFEGHVYLLRPTPEVYTAGALAHRTQLIYSTDISVITLLLNLRPGNLVVESGTGSGSLSRALLRIVAPHGHLYTFEFHKGRADGVREDLIADGFGKNVTVTHRDVCSDGFFDDDTDADSEKSSSSCPTPSKKIDAVMLDLPKPWEAIPHAVKILKYGVGRICCYRFFQFLISFFNSKKEEIQEKKV